MGDSWRTWSVPGDDDPNDYTWGTDCHGCGYREPHEHGFACERECPCKVERQWRERAEPKEAADERR